MTKCWLFHKWCPIGYSSSSHVIGLPQIDFIYQCVRCLNIKKQKYEGHAALWKLAEYKLRG